MPTRKQRHRNALERTRQAEKFALEKAQREKAQREQLRNRAARPSQTDDAVTTEGWHDGR